MALTPKQERFVTEYLIDLNAKQAAIRAGYSKASSQVQGCRLLTYAKVSEAIQKRQKALAEKVEVDQQWVLRRLKLISDTCVKPDKWDASGANKSTELLGKHLGMFSRVELVTPPGQPLELVDVTQIDLARRVAFLLSAALPAITIEGD